MEYFEAANFLFDLRRFRMKPGTESTARLLEHLGDPHTDLTAIQVAGTNGKGSTAGMVAAVLREAGLDVGLYTSPHMEDVRDRIRVNGHPMPKTDVVAFVERTRAYVTERGAERASPTFFEVLTAMALDHFAREAVDVAVLEVGIGGRHDATSVVSPTASAVTNVSLEHTELLGDTVAEIARDKSSVAPVDGPLVTGATGEALDAVRDAAGPVVTVGETPDADVTVTYHGIPDQSRPESAVEIAGPDWSVETRLGLCGHHQALNAGIAAALARAVTDVDERALTTGLRRAHWPGRFEILDRSPLTVLDGAHNPGACEALAATLAEFDYDDLVLVFGALFDKDHPAMARTLPRPDHVVVTKPRTDRAEDPAVLERVFEETGSLTVATRSAVEEAFEHASSVAGPDDCVLVTGSLYTVREARTRYTRTYIPKRVRSLDDARSVLGAADVTPPGIRRMRAKGVHRVLRTRVRPRQAQFLKEELLSLGGECALSGLNDQDEEAFDVVMMATLAQFDRLADKLAGQPYGLPVVAAQIRSALGIRTARPTHGYPWEDGTAVMGILNVTPDSFHDGGAYDTHAEAVDRAREMAAAGADIIDVGGESTRPGAEPVPPAVERDRVVPVLEELAPVDAMVSVDTRRASVARAAIDAGADLLNDVSGLADPEMRFLAAEHDVPLVAMHSLDVPVDPDRTVQYDDVVEDVIRHLRDLVIRVEAAGLDRGQVIVDPGLGFGKSPGEDFELLGRLHELRALGCPVMVGHSHKSMFGLIDRAPDERGPATVAASAVAAGNGADIIRVHDVAETVAAVRTAEAAGRGTASRLDR